MKALADGKGFKLGLFSANCSSGLAVTRVPERWSGSWADNLRLARLADEVGIDFLVPTPRTTSPTGSPASTRPASPG
ncbi:hypothetical protein LWC35_31395 [Pseudonocardia kujensis]|uniref:hypothetical protein n=1 Tax=Pseudonocardia kujensis TaxID=1128675 RepID=UPI001E4C1078|nr:hypothetical protein [Pseudonocardia kujensis]MCE0767376.1 hypothetical protein [Pseudonocardia kujensis]